MVNIEIDGKTIQAKEGVMLIEAADEVGINIPRFCYHKKLSVAANCRMCLVDVEKVAKPMPACATPVTEGMKVQTRSAKAIAAQQGVMEFLLINHPLDCPICDQGGECELQEIAIGYGSDTSTFSEQKRVVKDKNLGPLIATDMTRCIHCTRCVRFGQEIAGVRELGATGRGEHMTIGTYVENSISSELSGNIIDLCPVGALTSKPFRYTARAWEMEQRNSIAAHDCIGSNIRIDVRRNAVLRVAPRDNETINECWISDRDRFSYEGLNCSSRVQKPRIKVDGQWQETDWNSALEFVSSNLRTAVDKHGADKLGALVSPNATVEEMYLLQKLVRGMGSNNIDHRLRQTDFSAQDLAPTVPSLGRPLAELAQLNSALLIASRVNKEQPIAGHLLRRAANSGANIMFVNSEHYDFNFSVAEEIVTSTAGIEQALAGITKSLLSSTKKRAPAGLSALLKTIMPNEAEKKIAQQLLDSKESAVILGSQHSRHAHASTLQALAGVIAKLSGSTFGCLSEGANSTGACLSGAIPHRGPVNESRENPGLDAQAQLANKLNAYMLLGIEPEHDCADGENAITALENADFVVSMSPYTSATSERYADAILPVAPFSETSGTFVNIEGQWQTFAGAVAPLGETRPAWKLLRVLGNLFELDGFDYVSSEEVLNELKEHASTLKLNGKAEWRCPEKLAGADDDLGTLGVSEYSLDCIVRRAPSLQGTPDALESNAQNNNA
ncbi:MAG: NADH-quinone oxidoreductase subunit G [Gammaproteobacteria bacterium]|nr:NADH-quinone oxidoreductase subunit G [Gammaproteobacteria bacterium]